MIKILLPVVFVIPLTSCGTGNDPEKCPQPIHVTLSKSPMLDELEGSVRSCLHAQAYRLSGADGPAEQIVASVIQACRSTTDNWKQTIDNSNGEYAVAAIGDAYFQPMEEEFKKEALYRVTEARAGECKLK
jgi:hypothetical protein